MWRLPHGTNVPPFPPMRTLFGLRAFRVKHQLSSYSLHKILANALDICHLAVIWNDPSLKVCDMTDMKQYSFERRCVWQDDIIAAPPNNCSLKSKRWADRCDTVEKETGRLSCSN
jgi:hypothetical protein